MRESITDSMRSWCYRLQAALGIKPKGVCLVTGCPRSGTTAVINWLGRHRQVARFVESRILVCAHRYQDEVNRFIDLHASKNILTGMLRRVTLDYYARNKLIWRKWLIDKEPLEPIAFPDKRYKEFISNMETIMPGSRFIFMIRDPIATLWSMRQRKWGYSAHPESLKTFKLEDYVRNWIACVEIISDLASKENVYICVFEKLLVDPQVESQKIFDFLSIRSGQPFQPKATSVSSFQSSEQAYILRETKEKKNLIKFALQKNRQNISPFLFPK
jgi:hypothetical protein